MSAIEQRVPTMSVEEYLAAERAAEFRHEFVDGQMYCMAGASRNHGRVSLGLAAEIERHLRGKPCQTFVSDMKVHIVPGSEEFFYYPDIVVTCDERDRAHTHHIAHPKLIIEVLSPTTERIDRREKLFAYMQIDTIEEYVLVEQDFPEARIYRPANNWKYETAKDRLHLRSIDLAIDLAPIFSVLEPEA